MPRRKTQTFKNVNIDTKPLVNPSAYTSLIYGVVAVFVLFLIVIFGFRILSTTSKNEVTEQPESSVSQDKQDTQTETETLQTGSTYVVKEGDTLWSISESHYKTGFEWQRIATTNNIQTPSLIFSGMKLSIPPVSKESSLVVSQTRPSTLGTTVEKIEGNNYTVINGDTLWDISVRAYGDGYRWGEIARVNKLNNPDLIHPGNRFTIPR